MRIVMREEATDDEVARVREHLSAMGVHTTVETNNGGKRIVHTPDNRWETFMSVRLMPGIWEIVRGKRPLTDAHIAEIVLLDPPSAYKKRLTLSKKAAEAVLQSRRDIQTILHGKDHRFLVIVGPCSVHDAAAALDYAQKLAKLAQVVKDRVLVIMRAYFEKPRTSLGWEGLLFDPHLDESFDMPFGLFRARELLCNILELGLPTATEFTDSLTPQYLDDCVSWVAIGARGAEAPASRRFASGLSMPVGFKNGTGGSIKLAVDGVVASGHPHVFLGIDQEEGRAAAVKTTGNPHSHIVLRGSSRGPNYDEASVASAIRLLEQAGVNPRLLVDCSHDNSRKDHTRQPLVLHDVLRQRGSGNLGIIGVQIESNLKAGSQKLDPKNLSALEHGMSITDPCIGWEETEKLLLNTYEELGG